MNIPNNLIILLNGYSQSGKDYIGDILQRRYGFKRFAFADALKVFVCEKYKCPIETLHCQYGKQQICETDDKKRTYRQLLIDEAKELRSVNDAHFAEKTCNDILEHLQKNTGENRIVITDWRFLIELETIQKQLPDMKTFKIHIKRIDFHKSPVNDKSEYELVKVKCDYNLQNDLTHLIYKDIEYMFKIIPRYWQKVQESHFTVL